MNLGAPMEILIQPGLTFFIFQNAFARRIHTDGGSHAGGRTANYKAIRPQWVDEDHDGRSDVLENRDA